MGALLVGILLASAAAGFVVGRWWTVVFPIAAIGLFYAGLNAEWWGSGVGDGWQFAMFLVMALGVLATVIGVGARLVVRPREGRTGPSQAPR